MLYNALVVEIYLQIIWNSLVIAALYALIVIPFTVLYSVTRVLHVAHGAVVLLCGYVFAVGWDLGFGFAGALLLAVASGVIISVVMNRLVFENLRRRRPLTVTAGMLASVALLIILQNIIIAVWSSRTIVVHTPIDALASLQLGSLIVTPISLIIFAVVIPLIVVIGLFLRFSRFGRTMRAVSDNEEMAEVVGVNTRRVRRQTFALAGALAGVAGVLCALFFTLHPGYAVGYAVDAFSFAIVGGLGSVPGALVASLFLNLVSNLGGFWWTAGIKTLFAFIVVMAFLLLRPQGIFGKKLP